MAKKQARMAIVYDFDGTLSPGNMQEYDFIPELQMSSKRFWAEVASKAKEKKADKILTYMHWMLEKAKSKEVRVLKANFRKYAKDVELFRGVKSWFKRVNKYGAAQKISIEHYIISSGLHEMIDGTPIRGFFKRIFASAFLYDHHRVACWPAISVNYTTKTQFLFRINKGCLDLWDDTEINKYVPKSQRRIPFERMIYIGDGDTDVPCMKLVKDQGGHSIAVYKPHASRKKALSLIKQGRVNFVLPADYRKNTPLDRTIYLIIHKIADDVKLTKIQQPKTANGKKA
jgi:2-hydroxy-3-keto-5-methylthiopentenyl-1-phosphate phosphatase